MADKVELMMRFHPVGGEDVSLLSSDFADEAPALAAIARALGDLTNAVSVRVSTTVIGYEDYAALDPRTARRP